MAVEAVKPLNILTIVGHVARTDVYNAYCANSFDFTATLGNAEVYLSFNVCEKVYVGCHSSLLFSIVTVRSSKMPAHFCPIELHLFHVLQASFYVCIFLSPSSEARAKTSSCLLDLAFWHWIGPLVITGEAL